MTKIEEYRARMVARKAAAAGLSVEAFVARSEANYARTVRIGELRANPRTGWQCLIWHCLDRALRERTIHTFEVAS